MSIQLNWVFATSDYEGTLVVLSQTTWRTKAGNGEPGAHALTMNVRVFSTNFKLDAMTSPANISW